MSKEAFVSRGPCSMDVIREDTVISSVELITILRKLCEGNGLDDKTTQEIMRIAQTIVEQNYFRFRDTIYIQNEGLAMGAPTSSVLSEVYLDCMENTAIHQLLIKHKVEGYFRYVDDILMMYKDDKTNINKVLEDFKNLVPILNFPLEKEQNNQFNFLDITIKKSKMACPSKFIGDLKPLTSYYPGLMPPQRTQNSSYK